MENTTPSIFIVKWHLRKIADFAILIKQNIVTQELSDESKSTDESSSFFIQTF